MGCGGSKDEKVFKPTGIVAAETFTGDSHGYSMYWQFKSKTAEAAEQVAQLQIQNIPTVFTAEPGCTRVTVLKTNTTPTPGYPPMEVDPRRFRAIMQWKTETDFKAHQELPYEKEFRSRISQHGVHGDKEDFIVSHGPSWHIEKPGTSGKQCYTVLSSTVMRDLQSAQKLFQMSKEGAKAQIEHEKAGTLRITVFEPIALRPLKHYVVINVAGYKNSAFHIKHKDRKDPGREDFIKPFQEMIKDGSVITQTNYSEAGKVEFENSCHYEKE